jgi:hypothetical protein
MFKIGIQGIEMSTNSKDIKLLSPNYSTMIDDSPVFGPSLQW